MARIKKIIIGTLMFLALFLACKGELLCAQQKLVLRIGYLPILTQLPLIVSYENDRLNFKKIELKLVKYNSFTALEAAMRVGAIDFASFPIPIALSMAADGSRIKIIGTCHTGGSRVVAKKKGGLETLRGSLIGVPGLDSNENIILSRVLGDIDLRPGLEYKTIGITFNTVIKDMKAQKLDALYLPEPFGTIAEKEDIAVSVEGQGGRLTGKLGTVLVIRSEIINKSTAGVTEWLESLVKNCRFIEQDVSQSQAQQTAIIQEPYFNYPKDIIADSLTQHNGDLRFDHFVPSPEKIKTYMDLATQMKILTKSVDLNTLIATDLINRIVK